MHARKTTQAKLEREQKMLKPLTAEQMINTGLFGKVVGQVTNIWEFADEKTGEVMEGAKITFYGGAQSVRFEDRSQIALLKEGDYIEWEGPAHVSKNGIKFGNGRLIKLNGAAINAKVK